MISIQNLTKRYGHNVVLNNISVQFQAGIIYGMVGTNGCGKTNFNAMDKESMEEVHGLLQKFKAEGKTIILASHSAADIKKACDVVYKMEDGALHRITECVPQ